MGNTICFAFNELLPGRDKFILGTFGWNSNTPADPITIRTHFSHKSKSIIASAMHVKPPVMHLEINWTQPINIASFQLKIGPIRQSSKMQLQIS